MRKRGFALLLALVLALSFTACGDGAQDSTRTAENVDTASSASAAIGSALTDAQEGAESASTQPEAEAETASEHSDTLVVVFSATGNTRGIAETIAVLTGADYYEITPAQPYTEKGFELQRCDLYYGIHESTDSEDLDLQWFCTGARESGCGIWKRDAVRHRHG